MENIYIFGHKNPDTDSVTSAIALEYLKKQMGVNAQAMVLGEVNKETKYALDYFGGKVPAYLNDVKLQLKDVNYHKGCFMNEKSSIMDIYKYMEEKNITGVPLVKDGNVFSGLITLKMLARNMINGDYRRINTSYDNILKVLGGVEVLRFDEEIEGNSLIAAYRSTTFITNVNLTNDDILIVGDRHNIIEKAVNNNVKLIILTGGARMEDAHFEIAKDNRVNVITTNLDTFQTSKLIGFCNYASTLIGNEKIYTFDQNDYYNDFVSIGNKLKFNNYPIVDKNNVCLGLIRVTEITEKNRKKVILVDHNELEQSAVGLEEAEIVEMVDHHKIGNISTNNPINFRNMSVGSTNTIVYQMYKENSVDIPKSIAGLMLSGILSDTLCLTSPTTTELDKATVEALSKIAEVDYEKYALDMFKAGTSLEGKTIDEIVNTDIKAFHTETSNFAVSQVFTLDYEKILDNKNDYIEVIEKIKENKDYDFVILAVTDIIKNGSYMFFTSGCEEMLELSYNIKNFSEGTYVDGCVSRKKQIVPVLMEFLK